MNLIQTAFLYYAVISVVESVIGFNQRCPGQNERHFRRKNCTTPDKPFYTCLYNEYSLQYSENCTRQEYESRKGKKVVFSPGISETNCADSRFQPFKFSTHGFSDCIYPKSTCSEEGQVLVKNGSSLVDRSCRCDYRKGYDYITQPKEKCFCEPSLEDCSCYLTNCTGNSALTQDYECVLKIHSRSGSIVCGKILNGSPANVTTNTNNTFVDKKEHPSTSAFTALTSILIIMIITVVLILMLWVSLNIKVMPHIMESKGISDRIIYEEDGIPKTYHLIEGENFTIWCEIRSLLPVKSVRWQKDGHDLNSPCNKYKLNDSETYLTIENLSKDDKGNYECIVSNWLGLNNTAVDRCVSYLSALHTWMKCVKNLQQFKACRKEDQNSINLIVHNLPRENEYELIEKQRGDNVTMKPCIAEDIKKVVWFYKTENVLSALKPDLDLHGDLNDEGFKDYAQEVIKTTFSDNGHYVCFVVTAKGDIFSQGWNLTVIPQGRTYLEVLQHRKDKSYVRTSTVDKAVDCLKTKGFVVIVGRKGTGKSKMCLQLESVFAEIDYLPFEVHKNLEPKEIADLESTRITFFLDDSDYSHECYDQSLGLLPEVSDKSKAKVIVTCTHAKLPHVKQILQKKGLYCDTAVVDLDNKANILPLEEKKEILERSSNSVSVKLDGNLVKTIIETEPFLGFPLMVKKFCSKEKNYLQKGEKYFINPPKFLRKEIEDLYRTSKTSMDPVLINEYCVLAYIATDERHCIDLSSGNFDVEKFHQLKNIIYGEVLKSPLNHIVDHVDKLVWKYLVKSDEYTYKFIHPVVLKAVFLSSRHFINHIIENGEIENIIEFIRSVKYTVSTDELVLKLENVDKYHILCERLLLLFIAKPELGNKIGDYIYHHFIQIRDSKFRMILFPIMKEHFHVSQIDFVKAKNSNSSPSPMITLMEHLTKTGKDSWIYSHDEKKTSVPDFVILYGLVWACKNNFCKNEEQKKTFDALYALFSLRIKYEDFQAKLCTPMDMYGNVFCHFLTMFSEIESCMILEKLLQCLSEQNYLHKPSTKEDRISYKIANIFEETPIQMSAYLGKAKVFKVFFENSKMKENKRKHLLKTAKFGMSLIHGSRSSTSEIRSFLNLDMDYSSLVLKGEKEGYTDIIKTLEKQL